MMVQKTNSQQAVSSNASNAQQKRPSQTEAEFFDITEEEQTTEALGTEDLHGSTIALNVRFNQNKDSEQVKNSIMKMNTTSMVQNENMYVSQTNRMSLSAEKAVNVSGRPLSKAQIAYNAMMGTSNRGKKKKVFGVYDDEPLIQSEEKNQKVTEEI